MNLENPGYDKEEDILNLAVNRYFYLRFRDLTLLKQFDINIMKLVKL